MKNLFFILSFFFFSIQSSGQVNNSVLSIDSAKHFSVGSFVSFYQGEKTGNFDYRENTYATTDGGTGTLLRFEDTETPAGVYQYLFDVKLFPNPNAGYFSIETNSDSPMSIFIYDIIGNLVYEGLNIGTQYANIDLSKNSKGVYFVKTICGTNFNVSRIVIQ